MTTFTASPYRARKSATINSKLNKSVDHRTKGKRDDFDADLNDRNPFDNKGEIFNVKGALDSMTPAKAPTNNN